MKNDIPEFKYTKCDHCRKEFTIQIEKRSLGDSVEQEYFKCPECGREYTILITDKELRKKIERRQRLAAILRKQGKTLGVAGIRRKVKEMNELKKDIMDGSKKLREQYLKES